MKKIGFHFSVAVVIGALVIASAWAKSKTLNDYIADLASSNPQTQAVAAKKILKNPEEVPVIALDRSILIAGQQRLADTKQSLIKVLQIASYRGTSRALAADSLGLIARSSAAGPDRNDIYKALFAATYDRFWDVRLAACRALGMTGNLDAVVRLNELFLNDPDPRVQLCAGEAYLKITGAYPGGQPSSATAAASSSAASTPSSPPPTVDSTYQRILDYINTYIKILKK